MSTASIIAALVVGVFYACAGWNKLFEPIRRSEMRMNMRMLLPIAPRFFYWFVSVSQLTFGTALILAVILFRPGVWIPAVALGIVSLVAFILHGTSVVKDWEPRNWMDWIACILYTPEALLTALSVCAAYGG